MIKAVVLSGMVLGLAVLTGCSGEGNATHRDTGIGAESGRLIGSEVGGRTSWLGGQIGSVVGRQAEKGIAETATSGGNNAGRAD